jgi:hypothetical protein
VITIRYPLKPVPVWQQIAAGDNDRAITHESVKFRGQDALYLQTRAESILQWVGSDDSHTIAILNKSLPYTDFQRIAKKIKLQKKLYK